LSKLLKLIGTPKKGGEQNMATIVVDDSENLEKAIKRFKRMVEKEGIVREYKKREYYVKPSATVHQKKTTLERKLQNKRRKSEKKDY
jgi:small subunit ribosomal protein S21